MRNPFKRRSQEFHFGAADMGHLTKYAHDLSSAHYNWTELQQGLDSGRIPKEDSAFHEAQIGIKLSDARMANTPRPGPHQMLVGKAKVKGMRKSDGGQERMWN